MGRNYLKGRDGDRLNAVLAAAGYNFSLLLRWLERPPVRRIMRAAASPVDAPWLWTLAFGHHEDRTPTHGYAATRDAKFVPGLVYHSRTLTQHDPIARLVPRRARPP